jgi:hypothetical protein
VWQLQKKGRKMSIRRKRIKELVKQLLAPRAINRARIAFQGAMEFLFEQNFRLPELFLGKVCSCDALRSALLCHLRLSVSNVFRLAARPLFNPSGRSRGLSASRPA